MTPRALPLPPSDKQIVLTDEARNLLILGGGKLKNGNDFSETESFTFSKDVKPKAVGITLAGPGLGKSTITVGDW